MADKCGPRRSVNSILERLRFRVHVQKAVNDAVARVDAPLLKTYSQLRSKGDKAGLVQLAKAN